MIVTDRKLFRELAGSYDLVPVSRRVPADTETPVSTYLKVAREPWSFLLESVEGGTRWGRYSIVGLDPFLTIRCRGSLGVLEYLESGESVEGEPQALIRRALAENRMPQVPGLPRFAGGLVGYFGYGAARLFERLPPPLTDPVGLPDIHLFAPRKLLAFDNVRQSLDIIVLARPGSDPDAAYDSAVAETEAIFRKLRASLTEADAFPAGGPEVEIEPVIPRERFEEMVSLAREAIFAGEAIQIVVSQPFEGRGEPDPFTVYRALRALNPSPYLFHLAMGEEVLVARWSILYSLSAPPMCSVKSWWV